MYTNLFLHVMPTRIHRYSLKLKATMGLGVISLVLFVLLTATGVALMIYYKPATDQAYDSMKDIPKCATSVACKNSCCWGPTT